MNKRSILCAVDFSHASEEAIRFAVEEAKLRNATLDLVHVWHADILPMDPIGFAHDADHVAEAQTAMQQLPVPSGVRECRKHVLKGMPRDCIADLADRLGSELLVVGSHSQPLLARWLLGSVAEALTRVAPCPVVVVRPRCERSDIEEEQQITNQYLAIV